ncbi:MAG: ATP-binding protein [Ferruginibacter sp.]
MLNNSECVPLFNAINWSKHPLGVPANWPQSLTSTLSIIFNSKFPMFLFWGPDLYCFYKDAYRPSMGNTGKHPAAMGEKGKVVWPEIWDFIYPEIEQVMNGGESTWHEDLYLPIFRNNRMEDVYWTYSYSAVIGESGEVAGLLETCNETTSKVLAEKQMLDLTLQLQEQAGALVKLNEELVHFSYAVSHDLKEPLRTIKPFIKLLEKKYVSVLDDRASKYIHFAVDGAERMGDLINDMLEYSKAGEKNNDAENVNTNDIIEEIRQLLNLTIAEKEAKIEAAELPEIYISHAAIRQVFLNLIYNALKYQAPGVKPVISIETTQSNMQWQFAVKDNGIGISQDELVNVFIIFKRLNAAKSYSGTGIGMAICKKIVYHNGGKIWVESEEGKGSAFYFTISKN